ncbi:MAG: excinuclease ABC subunit UvrC [Candidatus Krumholzibacteriota bacterium]|nr:excinuclease ABC subunit UvrC [Candidatus Krumholzibacteriota bacterium]
MSSARIDNLRKTAKRLPASPGVYLMKNAAGRVVYVGKAGKLSNRVQSYLQDEAGLDPKTRALMRTVETIDFIATGNEVEALVLEYNLIQEHRPRYNIRLKDDKRYPYLRLSVKDPFPRLELTREIASDGAEYFGPYTDVRAVRRTMDLIGRLFPLRKCHTATFSTARKRECLNFRIERCLGPCTGRVDEKEYGRLVRSVRLFLRGRNTELLETLGKRMKTLAAAMRYEEAAVVRNQIRGIERITERQYVSLPSGGDEDVIAIRREGNRACGVVMKVREGRLLGSEAFLFSADAAAGDAEVREAFVTHYYRRSTDIPPRILVDGDLADGGIVERFLSKRVERRVVVHTPKRGGSARLVGLAASNAALKLLPPARTESAALLREVRTALGLPREPERIEAFDISTIQGSDAVGSMVTFVKGRASRSGYRRFRIRTVEASDDLAMMEEVVYRRLHRLKETRDRTPDLLLVDGGTGQLAAARRGMDRAEVTNIPVVSLAKKREEIFLEGEKKPIRLSRRSPVLRLLQRARDEAHRFAVEYHRRLRGKRLVTSEIDGIPGIGETRRIQLLIAFGSVERLREATVEEIAAVPGIGPRTARRVHEHLS